jgi:hypothetical protein
MELSSPALRAMRDRLAAALAPVDADFIAAGDELGRAISWLDGIREQMSRMQQALAGGNVEAAIGTLGAVADAIGIQSAQVEREAARVAALDAGLREVGTCIAALLETNRGLAALSVNSAIVSSGIAEESGDILNFSAEIRALLRASEQTVQGYAQSYREALRQLGRAAAAHAAFRRQQGHHVQEVAERIRRGLAEVAERRRQAGNAAGALQQRAESISSAISVTVAALQVGDATRQRIEHVIAGLDALGAGLEGAILPWSEGLPRTARDALAAHGVALQAALLRGAGEAFGTEVARSSAALARLGADARALVASGAELFGRTDATEGSFLAELERDLRLAATLLAEAGTRRDEVDQAMATVDSMMAALRDGLTAVRAAATDLRLVGLNAAFRCARVGPRGIALAAIARELRAQAWRMADGVEQLSAAVEAVLAASATAGAGASDAPGRALGETTLAMQDGLATLQLAAGAMDAAITGLEEDGRRAADTLTAISGVLSTTSELTPLLAEIADRIEPWSALRDGAGPALVRARLGLVNAATFTMAQERDIARARGVELEEPVMELEDALF